MFVFNRKITNRDGTHLNTCATRKRERLQAFLLKCGKKNLLTSDFYKKKFYSLSFQQRDSNAEFINKLQDALQKWLDAEKVEKNHESIFRFISKTQFYRKIDVQKLIFIK